MGWQVLQVFYQKNASIMSPIIKLLKKYEVFEWIE
jgi:hypothetical protein